MKAIIYDKKNKNLVYSEVEKPVPKENEVLVKIHASSVNAADYRSIQFGMIPKNKIFGVDISGVIEAVGPNSKKFKIGDEIIGELSAYGFGGFAEYVAVTEEALVMKPDSITFCEAAALPLAGITALQAIERAKIRTCDEVLVVGSSGGVGIYLVQLCKYFGANVTAMCSENNVEQTKNLGIVNVLDYKIDDYKKYKNYFTHILGVNGSYPLSFYKKALKKNGYFLHIGGKISQLIKVLVFGKLLSLGTKKMEVHLAKSNRETLEKIVKLAGEKSIKILIEKKYPLNETNKALEYLAKGHAKSKIVIEII